MLELRSTAQAEVNEARAEAEDARQAAREELASARAQITRDGLEWAREEALRIESERLDLLDRARSFKPSVEAMEVDHLSPATPSSSSSHRPDAVAARPSAVTLP